MKAKKISAILLTAAMTLSCAMTAQAVMAAEDSAAEETAAPKYIFLFIGDGMSYPQIQTTNYYLSAMADDGDEILTTKKLAAALISLRQNVLSSNFKGKLNSGGITKKKNTNNSNKVNNQQKRSKSGKYGQ